ncbi:MAG: hypothetical protein WC661_20885 [Opitutaceae bacterium]|jgi:hypothetical protein
MNQYRITKYNPKFRDARGAYMKPDWTSMSDVGRSFDGVTLEKEEYLATESAYIDSVMGFISEDQISALRAVGVENHRKVITPKEAHLVCAADLPEIIRSILREEFWCRLEIDDRFIHFGYDYYIYIGVKNRCAASIQSAQAKGLFVEPFTSPYLETEENRA